MRAVEDLQHASERHQESARIPRFLALGDVLRSVAGRQIVQVVSKVKGLSRHTREGDFDFEAATNFMALLTRLSRTEVQLQDAELWVNAIALRFAVSKAGTELLCAAAFGHAEYQRQVHDAHARIGVMAEQAMTHSVKGSPAVAVQTLLKQGEETLNAKLIELAGLVLQRHRERIDLYEAMMARVEALKEQYCSKGTRVSLNDTGQIGRASCRERV